MGAIAISLAQGAAALREGRQVDAELHYKEALRQDSRCTEAIAGLARVALAGGKTPEGLVLAQQTVKLSPSVVDFWVLFCEALRRAGRLQTAVGAGQQAIKLNRQCAAAWTALAQCMLDGGNHERALEFLIAACNCPEPSWQLLAQTAELANKLGRRQAARALLKKACTLDDVDDKVRVLYAQVLLTEQRPEAALEVLGHFAFGKVWEADHLYVMALLQLDRYDEVQKIISRLQVCWPEKESLLGARQVRALAAVGRIEEALSLVRQLLVKAPDDPSLWVEYGMLAPEKISPQERNQMEALVSACSGAGKAVLASVAARAHERAGNLSDQIRLLHVANEAQRSIEPYHRRDLEELSGFYRSIRLPALSASGSSRRRPIFILGLPRSGTSLLEQILSAHCQVSGLGEAALMKRITEASCENLAVGHMQNLLSGELPLEEVIVSLRQQAATEMAFWKVDTPVFTEKSIDNFFWAGIATAVFPDAKFICLRRHPMDLGLGCYQQMFMHPIPYTSCFEGIAQACRVMDTVVSHWKEQGIEIYELGYEALVDDLEGELRALLDYLSLPFDPACLEFQKNNRVVKTASLAQVRQGLFRHAVGRWKKYGELLAPLSEAFEREGVAVADYQPLRRGRLSDQQRLVSR